MARVACVAYQSSSDGIVEDCCHIVRHGDKENQPQISRSWDVANGRWTVWLNDNMFQSCLTFSADNGAEGVSMIRTGRFCV